MEEENAFTLEETTVATPDGWNLHVRTWRPKVPIIARVTFTHGLGEHAGRYLEVFPKFAKSGILVIAHDQRGHGKSSGKKGDTPRYECNIDDITLMFKRENDPNIPHFVYGHSMGGGMTIYWALTRSKDFNINGLILTGPWLILHKPPPKILIKVVSFLSHIFPRLTMDSKIDKTLLTRDPEETKTAIDDPLLHSKASIGLLRGCFDAATFNLKHAVEFVRPFLLMHGTGDQIVSPEGSKLFFPEATGCNDKNLKLWEGDYHEIHHETDRNEVIQTMVNWILERVNHGKNEPKAEEPQKTLEIS